MALESGTYVKDLVSTNPPGTDAISQGDDHIRLIKSVLKNSFPSNSNAPIVPDISGNGDKYLQVNSGASATQWVTLDVDALTRRKGELHRSRFEKVGSTTLRIHSGVYDLDAKGKNVSWDSYLDKGLSGTNGWRYIYLDYDAITGTTVTASGILESSTQPTYDESKHGWYNGNDRCILCVYVSGGSIYNFYHDGSDHIEYQDDVDHSAVTSTSYVTVTVPPLGSVGNRGTIFGEFTFKLYADGGDTNSATFYVSAAEGSGHLLGTVEGGGTSTTDEHVSGNKRIACYKANSTTMQVYVIKGGGSANISCTTYTNGWYLPVGM